MRSDFEAASGGKAASGTSARQGIGNVQDDSAGWKSGTARYTGPVPDRAFGVHRRYGMRCTLEQEAIFRGDAMSW
eukprot:708768-Rhodomonas_salina.1